MSELMIDDLIFEKYISETTIHNRILEMGEILRHQYSGTKPVFILVLKGALFFGADLIRAYGSDCYITNVQTSSYEGTKSTLEIIDLLNPDINLQSRPVVLVEDIVDTGFTLAFIRKKIEEYEPSSIEVVALLNKQDRRLNSEYADLIGFEIPDEFVIGYGLDYIQQGRQLRDIYKLKSPDNT